MFSIGTLVSFLGGVGGGVEVWEGGVDALFVTKDVFLFCDMWVVSSWDVFNQQRILKIELVKTLRCRCPVFRSVCDHPDWSACFCSQDHRRIILSWWGGGPGGEVLLVLHTAQTLKNSDCKMFFFLFGLIFSSHFLGGGGVTVDFRTLRIPLSLSPSLYIIACMMKTFLWTPAPLSGRGAGLLNSVRTLQYLEKSLDCCSHSSATTPQFFFFGTRAAILFCWLFLTLTENTSAVAVHLHWQKQISLTLTSSLWSQKFLFSYRYLVCTVALLNRLYSCLGGGTYSPPSLRYKKKTPIMLSEVQIFLTCAQWFQRSSMFISVLRSQVGSLLCFCFLY